MTTPDPFAQVPGEAQPSAQPAYAQPTYGEQPGYAPPAYDASPTYGVQPGYAQPGYAQSGYGTAPVFAASSPTTTDGVSIAALVTGLLGIGPLAIVLGAVGLRRTAEGRRGGTVMAWVGLIAGILATIAWTGFATATAVASWEISEAVTEGVESGWGSTYGADPVLDALWDSCEAGDNGACDDLFHESPLGSGYEDFGETCGGRGLPAGQTWCEA